MGLQHILVDEMQDTSTSQYELIQLLTQGWDGRSQTVFLVGDPKQSIYLFRQARVERFIRTMQQQRLGDLVLGCLRLTANFRSQSDLVHSFNDDFALLFPRRWMKTIPKPHPTLQPKLVRDGSPEVVAERRLARAGRLLRIHVEDRRRTDAGLRRREAAEVRRIIEQWRDASPSSGPHRAVEDRRAGAQSSSSHRDRG